MGPDRGCLIASSPLDVILLLAVILAAFIRATSIGRSQEGAHR
jgi:hypothetical protein